MEISIIDTWKSLTKDVKLYLHDAGFQYDLYEIQDFGNYIEVFFLCNKAVNYIVEDVKKSDFKYLEIKKYRYKTGICSAIITYR